jgi:hypothetical protein
MILGDLKFKIFSLISTKLTYGRRVHRRSGPTADQLGPGGQAEDARQGQVTHFH